MMMVVTEYSVFVRTRSINIELIFLINLISALQLNLYRTTPLATLKVALPL